MALFETPIPFEKREGGYTELVAAGLVARAAGTARLTLRKRQR